MADIEDTEEDWEETEDDLEEVPEPDNIMKFIDFVDPGEKQVQKQRITELRRRAEERQDWKKITSEYDLEIDDALGEA